MFGTADVPTSVTENVRPRGALVMEVCAAYHGRTHAHVNRVWLFVCMVSMAPLGRGLRSLSRTPCTCQNAQYGNHGVALNAFPFSIHGEYAHICGSTLGLISKVVQAMTDGPVRAVAHRELPVVGISIYPDT